MMVSDDGDGDDDSDDDTADASNAESNLITIQEEIQR